MGTAGRGHSPGPLPVIAAAGMQDTMEYNPSVASASSGAAPKQATYMRLVDKADEERRVRGSDGRSRSDGKRSLSAWHAVDAYSFGIVLWEVLTLAQPWAEETFIHKLWAKVRQGERPPVTAADEASAPEGYVALMRELWAQDPVVRPSFETALARLADMRSAAVEQETQEQEERQSASSAAEPDLDLVSSMFTSIGSAGFTPKTEA